VGPAGGYVPPSVGQTTVLINNTVYPGLFHSVDTEDSGRYPEAWGTTPAYDPSTNLFYEPVSNVTETATSLYYGGYLAAISPATDQLVGLVPVGLIPEGVAFDSHNGLLYVFNYDTNNISVVDPSPYAVTGSLGLPSHSDGDGSLAINASSGHLFLASVYGVYDVNLTNDLNVTISSYGATDVVYDNQTGEVYVVGSNSGSYPYVSFIGPNNDTLWKTIILPGATGTNPGVPAVDWKTDELYVPCGNNVSTVDLATGTLGPTLSLTTALLASPAAAFDPDNGMVYVVSEGYSGYNVTELAPATHTWVASSAQIPSAAYGGIAYSNGSQRLLVAGELQAGSSGFVMLSPALLVVGQPVSLEYPFYQSYFDPLTGYLFVPLEGIGTLGNVSVIDPGTGKIVAYVPAGAFPDAVWVDPNTGFGYIANFGPPPAGHVDNLTVFNAHTFAVTGSIPVGVRPYTLTYDPGDGYLYVGNGGTAGNGNVTVIDPATNTTVTSISLPGLTPGAAVYDPSTSDLYFVGSVAGEYYGAVYIVASNTLVGQVDLYDQPFGATYDGQTGLIYVEDTNGSTYVLQEFDPGSQSLVGSINLYHTSLYLAWDPYNDILYAPDEVNPSGGWDANTVTEVNVTDGALVNLTVGEHPNGIAVNASSGEAFVSDVNSGSVVFIDPGTPAPPSVYTVTLDTAPTTCSVTFNGVSYANGQQATGIPGGSYPLVANACTGETFSSWSSTAGTVTSSTSATTTILVSASGTVTGTYTTASTGYTVTFDAVPSTCSVTFNGVPYTNGQQATGVTAGFYPLVADACTGETFSSWSSTAGTVASTTTASTSVTVSATGTITATYAASGPQQYAVTFMETGLPTGTDWSVTFNGVPGSSSTNAISFSAPNGGYSYTVGAVTGFSSAPSSGAVTVASGPQTVTITFSAAPVTYVLIFVESGLPSGTAWSVTVDGSTNTSHGSSLTFTLANGLYSYSVAKVSGYSAAPGSGSVTLSGSDRTVSVTFTTSSGSTSGLLGLPGMDGYILIGLLLLLLAIIILLLARPHPKYPVVFIANGLPAGTRWSVTLDAATKGSDQNTITFAVAKEVHAYRVEPVAGFKARPASGTIQVEREKLDVPIVFTPAGPPK
jgi:DNA-binding beta-propeller fold protein YncE